MRSQRIAWDEPTLVDLIARRLVENEAFQSAFGISSASMFSSAERMAAINKLLPQRIKSMQTVSWIIKHVTDGTGEPNPRNVLTFLGSARRQQLIICDRDDPDFANQGSLISEDAVARAYKEVSKIRLTDTLYAEFNDLRPFIEKLTGTHWSYSYRQLQSTALIEPSDFPQVKASLIYSGLLSERPGRTLEVAPLYRPALRLHRMHSGQQARDLRKAARKRNARKKKQQPAQKKKQQQPQKKQP
jgi:hypothetical protein